MAPDPGPSSWIARPPEKSRPPLTPARRPLADQIAIDISFGRGAKFECANGITLAAQDSDQQAFTPLLILLRENFDLQPDAAAKQAFLATPQVIADIDGDPHTLPGIRQLRQMLAAYGSTLRDLWTDHATARAQIKAATTHEELDAVLAAD